MRFFEPRFLLTSSLLVVSSGVMALACGGGGDAGGTGGSTSSGSTESAGAGGATAGKIDCSPKAGAAPSLELTEIANNLERPLYLVPAPGDDDRLFIAGQTGKISILSKGTLVSTPFLDLSSIVFQPINQDERGLLGLAFHPDYAQNGRFFVYYTDKTTGNQVLAEYARSTDPDVAKPEAVDVLFSEPDSQTNHNGGMLAFGPKDGLLYIGMGDGGGGGDDHGTFGNGQNLATKWGKILRIDVSTTPYKIPSGNITAIPSGNPTTGTLVPEIWDYGLRNPWRFSFDACTGDLYIGDVGQKLLEEIDVEPAGQGNKNYGWRTMEGDKCFHGVTLPLDDKCDKTGLTLPVVAYPHKDTNGDDVGCSVTGGYVYRGSAIPALRGTYLYGDYCTGRIWSFVWANGSISSTMDLTDALDSGGISISSFGQDNRGELYLVDLRGSVYRIDPK
jgi:glucose/arabinose dehydrogenase